MGMIEEHIMPMTAAAEHAHAADRFAREILAILTLL
jgi:hypothetical protein